MNNSASCPLSILHNFTHDIGHALVDDFEAPIKGWLQYYMELFLVYMER